MRVTCQKCGGSGVRRFIMRHNGNPLGMSESDCLLCEGQGSVNQVDGRVRQNQRYLARRFRFDDDQAVAKVWVR